MIIYADNQIKVAAEAGGGKIGYFYNYRMSLIGLGIKGVGIDNVWSAR
jgi:hypothetical protein